ncbi:hypothetical protein CAP35_02500 [Chitinophagaceae bacterium IBVUCB1]|nr:hypothetical protein CAP35_02500 [Chitinophagaceae bacterium IBVUCB1]
MHKQYVPPVLIYLFGVHWLQVFAAVLYADYNGKTLEQAFNTAEKNIDVLLIITMMQIGIMVYYLSRILKIENKPTLELFNEAAAKLDVKKLLLLYAVVTLVFPTLLAITRSNSSVNQLVQAFAVIRKVIMLMMIFVVLLRKTNYNNTIIILIVLEFVLSFVSYFSSFKEILLMAIFAYLTIKPKMQSKQLFRLIPVSIILLTFLIFWSGVKEGYRNYLNQGTRMQEVNVSTSDALNYLGDKVGQFNVDSFKNGTDKLIYRMQYMQQYITVYERVPDIIPHTNGGNLTGTINFLLMPRFLDPNKAILDPSSKSSYYTGKTFANAAQGTSISMGYFCDLFIDFGLWWMIIPLLGLTLMIGKVSNYIINSDKYNIIFTYSLFIGTILSLGTFESDIIFYIGSVINYAVFMLLGNFFLFPFLNKYIKA